MQLSGIPYVYFFAKIRISRMNHLFSVSYNIFDLFLWGSNCSYSENSRVIYIFYDYYQFHGFCYWIKLSLLCNSKFLFFSAVGIFWDFVYQITFFMAFLALQGHREKLGGCDGNMFASRFFNLGTSCAQMTFLEFKK